MMIALKCGRIRLFGSPSLPSRCKFVIASHRLQREVKKREEIYVVQFARSWFLLRDTVSFTKMRVGLVRKQDCLLLVATVKARCLFVVPLLSCVYAMQIPMRECVLRTCNGQGVSAYMACTTNCEERERERERETNQQGVKGHLLAQGLSSLSNFGVYTSVNILGLQKEIAGGCGH